MLYEKYSTIFGFDPPTQNSLYIHPDNYIIATFISTLLTTVASSSTFQIMFETFAFLIPTS